jgi:hypothetical protein
MILHACSACGGDYEDPDRTAGPDAVDEEEGECGNESESEGDEATEASQDLRGGDAGDEPRAD